MVPAQEIRFEVRGRVASATLHRPNQMNDRTPLMESIFKRLLAMAPEDNGVAVVLTGAGRGFCAGTDMSGPSAPVAGAPAPNAATASACDFDQP